MRLIHTSDWHLGRSFHGVRLLGAQSTYLDHLVDVVSDEGVDAVVVAGDVYDRAIPAPDAVELLSDAIARLREAGAEVIIAPGNHDSARRLSFGSALLERAGVHIRAGVEDIGRPVLVDGVAIYPLPYLDPSACSVTEALGVSTRSHASVLAAAMDRVRADAQQRGPRTVVAAHCFTAGGASSESERDITVGGVSVVPSAVFDGIGYAALGHLHRPQQVTEHVRYSGSPVAMSFSEAGHTKGSLLVSLDAEGTARVEQVDAPVERPLAVLRGTLDELLSDQRHVHAEGAYVQATLTDPTRPRQAMDQLRRRFPFTLSLQLDPQGAPTPVRSRAMAVSGRPAIDVCADFVGDMRPGRPASTGERSLLVEALEQSRTQRRTADDEGVATTRSAGAA